MNLHFLTAGSGYFDGPCHLGVLVKEKRALLIDAGMEPSAAKKALRILKEHDIALEGVFLTHAHADHTGGAAFLRETCAIPIMASSLEKPFIENTILEPFYLFGGAHPLQEMEDNKFLKAPPCPVDICLNPGMQDVLGFSVDVVTLPGHSYGQIGLIYDTTFYIADSLFNPEILAKFGLPYFVQIGQALRTIECILSYAGSCRYFVPAHGPVVADPAGIAAANKECLENLTARVVAELASPLTTGDILAVLMKQNGMTLTNPSQYYLMKAGLKALLSHLASTGRIRVVFADNRLAWAAV